MNQRGFTLIEGLFVAVVVGALAFGGFYIFNENNKDEPLQTQTEQQENQDTANDEAESAFIDLGSEDKVTIFSLADIDNLPKETPASFVEFMKDSYDEPVADEFGCISATSIKKISSINVLGSSGSYDAQTRESGTEYCGSGIGIVWYLDSNGQWESLRFQDYKSCELLVENKIYAEFMEKCFDDNNQPVSNPNGSIKELNSL